LKASCCEFLGRPELFADYFEYEADRVFSRTIYESASSSFTDSNGQRGQPPLTQSTRGLSRGYAVWRRCLGGRPPE
jgi:hypothetical protein